MFEDRRDAGKKLAHELDKYGDEDVLVLAIPRGGVAVGFEVAKYLNARFSLLITRKLPFPANPEAGFGALAEDGSKVILDQAAARVPDEEIEKVMERQKEEIKNRIKELRREPLSSIKDETVILVDDGIAMGSTMRASIKFCKNKGAKKIVVAVPVASEEVAEEIGEMVDEIIVLEKPEFFRAVAQVYREWHDVSNDEVIQVMEKWERIKKL